MTDTKDYSNLLSFDEKQILKAHLDKLSHTSKLSELYTINKLLTTLKITLD